MLLNFIFIFMIICSVSEAQIVKPPLAYQVRVDITNFDGNLSVSDTTVQKALDTLDDMVSGGAPANCWQESDGALMPAVTCVADPLWELDANLDLEPV